MSLINYLLNGAVGVVSMAKPPHNLLDDVFIGELVEAYRRVIDAGCRAILLRSEMRHFCAGAEVGGFDTGTVEIQHNEKLVAEFFDVFENAPVPTVAAVHGGALGGGLELALTCDIIVAADTAYFGQVESIVGLIPLLGGTQRLVQRAGLARAKEIAMEARRYSPQVFERWGIINHVVPEAELGEASLSIARQLAAGPTAMLRGIKQLANASAREGCAAADRIQVKTTGEIWKTRDRTRGISAFLSTGPGTAVFEGD